MLPHDPPPQSTVYDHVDRWRDDGTCKTIVDTLRRRGRNDPCPGVGSIASQTIKATEVADHRSDGWGKTDTGCQPASERN